MRDHATPVGHTNAQVDGRAETSRSRVRCWHSQDGPDVVANGLALCALHHALFDLGVLGLTAELRIRVSSLYVARSDAGRAVDDLSGQPLLAPRPGQPVVEVNHVDWHHRQVFKGAASRPHKSRSGFDTDRSRPILNSIPVSHSTLLLSVSQ
jgi:hypothetical protein